MSTTADRRPYLVTFGLLLLSLLGGCQRGPKIVPVRGTVTYQGKPLRTGSVIFQPAMGQPASGIIQSDGTFVLSTRKEGDGATVGPHKVKITCYESRPQVPGGEPMLGKLLIPDRYIYFDRSGLTAEVVAGNDNNNFTFELTDN